LNNNMDTVDRHVVGGGSYGRGQWLSGPQTPASARNRQKTQEFAERLRPMLEELAALSSHKVVAELNRRGIKECAGRKMAPGDCRSTSAAPGDEATPLTGDGRTAEQPHRRRTKVLIADREINGWVPFSANYGANRPGYVVLIYVVDQVRGVRDEVCAKRCSVHIRDRQTACAATSVAQEFATAINRGQVRQLIAAARRIFPLPHTQLQLRSYAAGCSQRPWNDGLRRSRNAATPSK
jgi:hypothetical protein